MHTNGNGYACGGNAKFRLVMSMGSALIANCIVTDDTCVYRAAGSITAFSYSCTCDDRYNGPATTVNTVLFSN